jgi:glucose-1-phosphate adenylyltransferase
MYKKKECIAMLLAGGQGSRLGVLTKNLAKPAVPYGGKYRIIDFPLSNCTNSGIETVGVLTMYQPLELNDYIGSGRPWDLDTSRGGVHILQPYQRSSKVMDWYKGTANAIYQNINFIERYDPDYVVVLGGDHIYKMDYSKMVAFHKDNNADCTIAFMEVPMEEASRFGILNTNPDYSIYEFDEKPKVPKSNKASMGIYVFTWSKLRKYLEEDELDPNSSNDFGKNVLPNMLNAGERMFAYPFDGYWKDVGTIGSLWDANMDMMNPKMQLDLSDPTWKIYTRSMELPPHYIAAGASVEHSLISEGCNIYGTVDNCVMFGNVTVKPGAKVEYSVIMPGAVIEEGANVRYAIIAEDVVVGKNAVVGSRPEETPIDEWDIAVVGAKVKLGEGAVVKAKEMIDKDRMGVE